MHNELDACSFRSISLISVVINFLNLDFSCKSDSHSLTDYVVMSVWLIMV